MSEIECHDSITSEHRGLLARWWRQHDETMFGTDVVEQADHDNRYRQDLYLLYRNGREVIGIATGRCSLGLGYLFDLIVDVDHRGKGIGGSLLHEFEAACLTNNCRSMALRTQSLEARRFYESRGWTVEFESEQWFGGVPTYQMRKFFDI